MPTGTRILVTGGLGFIGAWVASELLDQGNSVISVDSSDISGSTAEALSLHKHDAFEHIQIDVRDGALGDHLPSDVNYVIHAAGILGVQNVIDNPILTLDVNITGTKNILEWAARQGSLRRLIVISTSEVYGIEARNAAESDELKIAMGSDRWGYAVSKLASEFIGRAYLAERSVPLTTVRPFNVYGPYRRGRNAVTSFASAVTRNQPLTIEGAGQEIRSWCYITDFVECVIRCLGCEDALGEVFNVGNPTRPLTTLELATLIRQIGGGSSEVIHIAARSAEVIVRTPDIQRARDILGYKPLVDIEDGLDQVMRHMRSEETRIDAHSLSR
jgi:nucleoside-diphosphate-sugar epimerase